MVISRGLDLTATYNATIDPVGAPISILASIDKPLHVWGTDAVQLSVTIDEVANEGYQFHVNFFLKNVADVPIYNVAIDMDPTKAEGFIYQPLQELTSNTAELAPGAILERDLILVPAIDGLYSTTAWVLTVRTVAGDVSDSTPTLVPVDLAAVPKLTFDTTTRKTAQLTWDPVPGATEYRVFRTPTPTTAFGKVPAAVTNGDTTSASVFIETNEEAPVRCQRDHQWASGHAAPACVRGRQLGGSPHTRDPRRGFGRRAELERGHRQAR